MCDKDLDSTVEPNMRDLYMASPFGWPSHPRGGDDEGEECA